MIVVEGLHLFRLEKGTQVEDLFRVLSHGLDGQPGLFCPRGSQGEGCFLAGVLEQLPVELKMTESAGGLVKTTQSVKLVLEGGLKLQSGLALFPDVAFFSQLERTGRLLVGVEKLPAFEFQASFKAGLQVMLGHQPSLFHRT